MYIGAGNEPLQILGFCNLYQVVDFIKMVMWSWLVQEDTCTRNLMTIDMSFLHMNCLLSVHVILAQPISASSGSIISLLHVVSPSISGKINTIQTDTREANSLNLIPLKNMNTWLIQLIDFRDKIASWARISWMHTLRGKHYYHALRVIGEQNFLRAF